MKDAVAVVDQGPVVASQATSLLQAITQAASNPQTDIEKMERLFAMHQQMVKAEAEAAFNAAMSRAQAKIIPVATNAENSHTRSRYAKLEAINRQIVPLYTAEGLSVSFDTADSPVQGWQRTVATVSHSSGHSRQYHLDLPPDAEGSKGTSNKTMVQATGSTNMYARRYLTNMIFNISTFDDNDGNSDARAMPEGVKMDYGNAIEACADADALGKLWKEIVSVCKQTPKDMDSYNTLKAKCEAKGKALKGKVAA